MSSSQSAVAANGVAAWLDAILDLSLTVAYIDGMFHVREQAFVLGHVEAVLQQIEQAAATPEERTWLRSAWKAHGDQVVARLHAEIAAQVDVPAGDAGTYVSTKLKVRAVTVFRGLDPASQTRALEIVQALIHADGVVHEAERVLYEELSAYYVTPASAAPTAAAAGAPAMFVRPPDDLPLSAGSHPLLDPLEQAYSPHPVERQAQLAWDVSQIDRTLLTWRRLRERGAGRLAGVPQVGQLPRGARFLDGYVHVAMPTAPLELIVLGDLHGCYSCLKAALLQSRFVERAWAHQWDPATYPDVRLVMLGDYIDRGRFSFDGVMRAALQLQIALPDQVYLLRGNHEYLVRHPDGEIRAGVSPAEALASIKPHAAPAVLEAYLALFEQMPTALLVDRTLFVHGGIPRDDTLAERWRDLSSLGDPTVRFQMMWSDPVHTDHVPVDLQRGTPRFQFGRKQFRAFLDRLGCDVMVRGHEQMDRGFESIYRQSDRLLLSVFSAGGHDNDDLPVGAGYRSVTPMALTITYGTGAPVATPWPIQYKPFCYEPHNGFYRPQPLLDYRYL